MHSWREHALLMRCVDLPFSAGQIEKVNRFFQTFERDENGLIGFTANSVAKGVYSLRMKGLPVQRLVML
jgi:hypothetical protein